MEETIHASDFAGHCTEVTAWRILRDISHELLSRKGGNIIRPSLIKAEANEDFTLEEHAADTTVDGFDAPEVERTGRTTEGDVWSLGASVFSVMRGCQVMNGKGGRRQTSLSRVPYLKNSLPDLSELIRQCLQYRPDQRPSMKTINETAIAHYNRCMETISQGPVFRQKTETTNDAGQDHAGFWPEQMIN